MDRVDGPIIPADTGWLTDAGAVCRAISAGGHKVYFVGGCVRNALLGADASDVDLATDALPERVMALAVDAGLKAVPTGIDHGTVTVVADGIPFEVTTFRRDVATDGRRAVVAFSTDILDDARRRDFTMNALYATPEGRVVDPLGGLPDLVARRIRFIDDADARIREDYLRVLRYFRFHAWYGDTADGFDPDALAAIGANLDGLDTLSGERIGAEMQKLLQAPDPVFAVAGMAQAAVLNVILPGAAVPMLAMVVHFEDALALQPDWHRRLAALGGEDPANRWRLSKADARVIALIRTGAYDGPGLPEIAYREGTDVAIGAALLRAAMSEREPSHDMLATLEHAATMVFPVSAQDLMPDFSGPDLGQRLRELETRWINSGFALTRDDLLR